VKKELEEAAFMRRLAVWAPESGEVLTVNHLHDYRKIFRFEIRGAFEEILRIFNFSCM
jgi:hypothetical protein